MLHFPQLPKGRNNPSVHSDKQCGLATSKEYYAVFKKREIDMTYMSIEDILLNEISQHKRTQHHVIL
jgi:hypothetical protein